MSNKYEVLQWRYQLFFAVDSIYKLLRAVEASISPKKR
jgi:hypothetical protein